MGADERCWRTPRVLQQLPHLLLLLLAALQLQVHASLLQGREHPCARPCVAGRPLTCRYDFHVENYHSMSKACYGCPWNATDCARPDCIAADGVARALVVINRMMPGPSLQVCLGDKIEVAVHNHMPEQSTSVHWHGMQQRGTPYMDGVPFVTQCPVQPHSAFRYSFRAETHGTHFWHSHTGCQRADGAVGLLTVRVPKTLDPHAKLYDVDLPEHGILAWDWTHTPAASKFLAHHHAGDDNKADSVLINGKGTARKFPSGDGAVVTTPREVFTVKQGLRYRFRLVNAGFLNCPLELSIDNHTLLVIATDGADVKPVRVDSLVSYAGERWDFVVEATQPVANYWVRMHGLLDCGPRRAHEAAVLRYEGADPTQDPAGLAPSYDVHPGTTGLQVNPLNRGSANPDTITSAELQAVPSVLQPHPERDPALKPKADVQLFVSYDFYAVDNPHIHRAGLYGISQVRSSPHRVFTPQLNHISLSLPAFPLLSGRDRLDSPLLSLHSPGLCNETSLREQGKDCTREYCECTHVIRVPLGGVLEIVLVDQGVRYDANHPFHLHGHAFRVVALERLGTSTTVSDVQRLDAEGRLAKNLVDPPTKDTVTVPDGGYTVLRVHADNPGYWLFHCHIEFHVELGMALVVKVGEHEDMPPVPRGFPQCGDWGNNNWLGGSDDDDTSVQDDVHDDVDVADKLDKSGNHIARVLDAHPNKLAAPSSSPLTSTEAISLPAATPSPGAPTSALTGTEAAEVSTEVTMQDTGTKLPILPSSDRADEFNSDSTTPRSADDVGEDSDDGVASTTVAEMDLTTTAVPSTDSHPTLAAHVYPSELSSTTAPAPSPAPSPVHHVVLSEFIMRVSSSTSRRRASEAAQERERAESRDRWLLAEPARPDLRYNVLLDQEPPRTAAVTAERAYGHAATLTPLWAPLVSTIVCLTLALS